MHRVPLPAWPIRPLRIGWMVASLSWNVLCGAWSVRVPTAYPRDVTSRGGRYHNHMYAGVVKVLSASQPPLSRASVQTSSAQFLVATRGRTVDCLLRHEVARLIIWHAGVTRPAVPSAVSYADVREGHDPYSACGHGTHRHPTGTRTVRKRCIC